MRTNIYVDGYNLYYGALRSTKYKWLNLHELCRTVLQPHHDIGRIRYFTARVKPRPNDPQQGARQQAYLRALATIPRLSIHFGEFLTHAIEMPLADPHNRTMPQLLPDGRVRKVRVIKTEEKGSDVNLAHFLVVDGFRKDYEAAVVVSNDSDLKTPIHFVRRDLKLPVGVLNPHPPRKRSFELQKVAKFHLQLDERHLQQSQFPTVVIDAQGRQIRKPRGW